MKKKNKSEGVLNRFGALLLVALLLFTGMPVMAFAEEGNAAETGVAPEETQNTIAEEIQIPMEVIVPDEGALPDSDVLLEQYIDKLAFGDTSTSETPQAGKIKLKAARKVNLGANEQKVYDAVKGAIKDIADGKSVDTIISVPIKSYFEKSTYYPEDFGVESLFDDEGYMTVDLFTEAGIDANKVFNALLFDCPYELYWFDKTDTGAVSYNIEHIGVLTPDRRGVVLSDDISLVFYFGVAKEYAAEDDPSTEDVDESLYATSITETQAAYNTVQAAQKVVSDNAGKSDYEKLKAYLDYICAQVDYNYNAANTPTAYGNPWQLIWVFDGDNSTDVVCEGYSKAFKFLCDLTREQDGFTNKTIDCHIVSGNMGGGTGAGGHMWNIVTIDGNNYLVDATNCDEGSVGTPDKLFLVGKEDGPYDIPMTITENGVERQVVAEQYIFPSLKTKNNQTGQMESLTYIYDFDTVEMYSKSERLLADANYEPPTQEEPLDSPTDLAWADNEDGTKYATWKGVDGAEQYLIQINKDGEYYTAISVSANSSPDTAGTEYGDTVKNMFSTNINNGGSGTYTFTVQAVKGQSPNFVKSAIVESEEYEHVVVSDLRVWTPGHGSVKVNGTDSGTEYQGAWNEGTEISIEAVPAEGYKFGRWLITKKDGSTSLVRDAATTLTAGTDIAAEVRFGLETASLEIAAPIANQTTETAPTVILPDGAGYAIDSNWFGGVWWADSAEYSVLPTWREEPVTFVEGETYYAHVRLRDGTDSFAAGAGGHSFDTNLEVIGGTKSWQSNSSQSGDNIEPYIAIDAVIAVQAVADPNAITSVTTSPTSYTYDGEEKTPTITVKVGSLTIPPSDYTAVIKDKDGNVITAPVKAGTYTVEVTGNGNYVGTVTASFVIEAADIKDATVEGIIDHCMGDVAQENMKVTFGQKVLEEGKDYDVLSYIESLDIVNVQIEGINNYKGVKVVQYNLVHDWSEWILAKAPTCTEVGYEIRDCSRNIFHRDTKEIPAFGHSYGEPIYTWSADNKSITATRICVHDSSHKESEVGKVTWKVTKQQTSTEKGETIYTATFKNSAFKTQTKTVEGVPTQDISKATVAGISNKTYNGKAQPQNPTVKLNGATLKSGTDYTVSYKDSKGKAIAANQVKAVGTYSVVIIGKGNYTGTVTKTFKINKAPAPTGRRLSGADRFGTADAIAKGFKTDSKQSSLPGLIVAYGFGAPDALSAGPLAAKLNLPIQMVDKNNGSETRLVNWIKKNVQKGSTIYIIGGPFAVREDFVKKVKKAGYKASRVAGSDRIGTNLEVLKRVKLTSKSEVLVAEGSFKTVKGVKNNSFQNALIASATGKPLLLVQTGGLTNEQKNYLQKNKVSKFVIIGDTSSVSNTVQSQLKAYAKTVERVSASNADAMSAKVAEKYWPDGAQQVFLATSNNFADALTGGPECIVNDGPIFLINDKQYKNSQKYLKGIVFKRVTALGGTFVVPEALAKTVSGVAIK